MSSNYTSGITTVGPSSTTAWIVDVGRILRYPAPAPTRDWVSSLCLHFRLRGPQILIYNKLVLSSLRTVTPSDFSQPQCLSDCMGGGLSVSPRFITIGRSLPTDSVTPFGLEPLFVVNVRLTQLFPPSHPHPSHCLLHLDCSRRRPLLFSDQVV